jgi:hypothetical protein
LGGRASEVEAKRKFTVAEAFETRRARSEGEESRNRKVKAEAEASEDPQRLKFSNSMSKLRLFDSIFRENLFPDDAFLEGTAGLSLIGTLSALEYFPVKSPAVCL